MSVLFDDRGSYRLTPAQRTCTRCGHVLVGEDELGLYYQVPVEENVGPLFPGAPDAVLSFASRVHECDGQPHQLPGETDFPGVIRGQVWRWDDVKILVTRVARDGSWADIRARAGHGSGWSKRQPLPFPDTWELTSEYVVLS